MMIRLQYESAFGTFDAARTLYETFLRSYPDDIATIQLWNFAA